MLLRAYSLFDSKALQYHPPFFASTDGAAVRSCQDLANDLSTTIGRHPADYVLFCVGTYDDSNAHFEALRPLNHVVDMIALVAIKPTGDLFSRSMGLTPRSAEEMAHDAKMNGAA